MSGTQGSYWQDSSQVSEKYHKTLIIFTNKSNWNFLSISNLGYNMSLQLTIINNETTFDYFSQSVDENKDMVAIAASYSFPLKVHDKNKLPFSCLYVITNYMINNTWFTSTVT